MSENFHLDLTFNVPDTKNSFEYVHRLFGDEIVSVHEYVDGTQWWAAIEPDGQTLRVGVGSASAPAYHALWEIANAGDGRNMSYVWNSLYDENIDTYLYWLWSIYRGYRVVVRSTLIGKNIDENYYEVNDTASFMTSIEVDGIRLSHEDFTQMTGYGARVVHARVPRTSPLITGYKVLREYAPTLNQLLNAAKGASYINRRVTRRGLLINFFEYPEIGGLVLRHTDETLAVPYAFPSRVTPASVIVR